MLPDATDDLQLLAERLRLGLPLRGFDGREIPLRTVSGDCVDAIEAANALLLSGASLLSSDYELPRFDGELPQTMEVDWARVWQTGPK